MRRLTQRVLLGVSLVVAGGWIAPACTSSGKTAGDDDDNGGAAGDDSGGKGGSAADSGAGAVSSGGNGGAAAGGGGADPDGASGEGGAGGEAGGGTESPLEVLEVSPVSDAEDVERDAVIAVTFSEEIDAASVGADSFSVTGPGGAIEGAIEVAGETVTFTPDRPLPLLGRIGVALSEDVASADGSGLTGGFASEFVVRDGAFGRPVQLTASNAVNLTMTDNDRGDVLATWTFSGNIFAAVYDSTRATWATAQPIESSARAMSFVSPALNEAGNAIVSFYGTGTAGSGWSRYSPANGWTAARFDATAADRAVALTSDGTAHSIMNLTADALTYSSLGPTATAWSATQPVATSASRWFLRSLGSSLLATYRSTSTDTYSGSLWGPSTGWSMPSSIGNAGAGLNWGGLDVRDGQALLAWHEAGGSRARRYDGSTWSPIMTLGRSGSWSTCALAPPYGMVAWGEGTNVWVRGFSESGWGAGQSLGSSTGILSPALAIDRNGAALAAWVDGTTVRYRRFVPGGSWSAAAPVPGVDRQVTLWDTWAGGAVDGSIMLIWHVSNAGVWAARFE